ncbi:MAG: hypothetical protein RLZZ398_903 [Verrucomicrobiota bacterium]|jgi:hypothetical protein
MKLTPPLVIFAAAFTLASTADEVKSTVRFFNDDQLTGSVESLTTERLVLKSPILEKPALFLLKDVLDLTLAATPPESVARHEASVTLTRGDVVRGQLASVSDEAVELDTWFAGRMKFNRLNIADIKISERPEFIYRGPTGLEGWKQSGEKPAWTFQNSRFRSVAAGSIARNVELPDECSIAFDAAWRGSFALKLVFFSDDLASDHPASGYEMAIQSRSVYLRSCKTQKFLGHTASAVTLQENEKAHIEVRVSLKSGKVCLFLDGHIIDVWTDPDVVREEIGRGIHFITQNESPVQISGIEVSAWDGEVDPLPKPQEMGGLRQFGIQGLMEEEDEPEESAPEEAPNKRRVELHNGDSIDGEVVSISDGMITLKTPFRDVRLPVEALRTIALKPVDLETSKRENGDVKAWFADGSWLVFRLEGVDEGTLTGYSQAFGTAVFKMAAFSRIEFNIYDPAFEELRMTNGW